MKQREAFRESEGDRYFERNKGNVADSVDPVLRAVTEARLAPRRILEVGAGNGRRLAALAARYGAEIDGVEPSVSAIGDAAQRYGITLTHGTAESLPFPDARFDMLIFGFSLYLCDREELFDIAREADRVLGDGGTLVIYDFLAREPHRNAYRHRPGLYSYKMDYKQMFLWNPAYHLIGERWFAHPGAAPGEPDATLAVSVLGKSAADAYPERTRADPAGTRS